MPLPGETETVRERNCGNRERESPAQES